MPDEYKFISALIHFAGAGYEYPSTLEIKSDQISILKSYLQDCRPGTIILIDNIKLKDKNGAIISADNFTCALF